MKRLFFLLPFLFGATVNITSAKGLVFWAPFTTTYSNGTIGSDRTPNENDCTVNGGATFTATGITLASGSSQYLDCGDSDVFSFTDGAGQDKPFSVAMWVTPVSQQNMHIFSKITGAAREWTISSGSAAGKPLFVLYTDSSNHICTRPVTAYSDTGVSTCYVFTYDGTEVFGGMKHYRNGVETTIESCSTGTHTGMSNTSATLKIGYNSFSYSSMTALTGQIFNRVLSADDAEEWCARNSLGNEIQINPSRPDIKVTP